MVTSDWWFLIISSIVAKSPTLRDVIPVLSSTCTYWNYAPVFDLFFFSCMSINTDGTNYESILEFLRLMSNFDQLTQLMDVGEKWYMRDSVVSCYKRHFWRTKWAHFRCFCWLVLCIQIMFAYSFSNFYVML